jgi:peptidyl-prolyl cis-trans isomerase A (cyclophilin A)
MRLTISVRSLLGTSCLALALAAAVGAQGGDAPSLKDPSTMTADCPPVYRAKFDTSQGEFVVEVERDWAPRAAIRFYNLVKNGYFNDNRFFRVLSGFMAQFGITGDPALNAVWRRAVIIDDARKQSNERGYLSFASAGPNTRTTQVFVNLKDNFQLDGANFAPFGHVVSGMNVVEKLYTGYGDGPPNGSGPEQSKVQIEGNAYLAKQFPKLDYIKTATLVDATKK